ncbi:TRASH domain-containing protein [Reyranella sp.]|uniref:TRASH domain-containing protein n=1 Tax=Reyranella sp. TaxID=1929291 RepID=UPI0037848E95
MGDVGQRQVGHRVAEHRHHQPDGDGGHREPARPALGHSVGRRGCCLGSLGHAYCGTVITSPPIVVRCMKRLYFTVS